MHSYILDDASEDTDVFHVLTRKPSVPETVITKPFVVHFDTDRTVRYVGTSKALLRKK
jgi:hypothetical protein